MALGARSSGFAERHSHGRGRRATRLELLVPRGWTHPEKRKLDAWYRRIGYGAVSTASVDSAYPRLAPLLCTPCDFVVYEKPLTAARTPRED